MLVTHDVGEALLLANRIALLEGGKLMGIYSQSEFLESSDATVAGVSRGLEREHASRRKDGHVGIS